MSIIHEALKKAQLDRPKNRDLIDATAPGTEAKPAAAPPPKQSVNNVHLMWYALALILIAATFFNLCEYSQQISQPSAIQTAISPPPTPALNQSTPAASLAQITAQLEEQKTISPPPQPQKNEIILSGIVEMDGKKFALINNEFYETGEAVEDATITLITPESINILQNGKARTIKVLRSK